MSADNLSNLPDDSLQEPSRARPVKRRHKEQPFEGSIEKSVDALLAEREQTDSYADQWGDSALSTRGVRENTRKVFQITLSGREIYALLEFTREAASLRHEYNHIRRCVLLHELLLLRARSVGF